MKIENNKMKYSVVIKIGLIISVMMTLSLILGSLSYTGTLGKDSLIDLGKKKEISQKNMLHALYGVEYNPETELFTVVDCPTQEVDPNHYIVMRTGSKWDDWNYLKLNIEAPSTYIYFTAYYYDVDMVYLGSTGGGISEETNEYNLPIPYATGESESIEYIYLFFSAEEDVVGESFSIKSAILYQHFYDIEDYIKHVLGWFLAFNCIFFVVFITKSLGADIWNRYLQMLYRMMSPRKVDGQARPVLATLLFFVMFTLMILMNIFCYQELAESTRVWMIGFAILLYLIGVCGRKHSEGYNWNTGISYAWYFLWLLVTVSDVIMHKSYPYTGIIMLVFGGFVIYSWQQEWERLMEAMCRGLTLTIIPMTVYCLIYRLKKVAVGYHGPFRSSEAMGLYSVALLIAFLTLLVRALSKKRLESAGIVLNILGAMISMLYLYMARDRWTMIAGGAVIAVFVIYVFKECLAKQSDIWKKSGIIFIAIIISIVSCYGINKGVKTLPSRLEKNIVYENEIFTTEASEELAAAMMSTYPGWEENVEILEEDYEYEILRKYVNNLNFTGHKEYLKEDEVYVYPNNTFIAMVYRYGMFVLIPYLLFVITIIGYAVVRFDYTLVFVVASFLIASMGTNVSVPFAQPLWVMLYLICGRYFCDGEKQSITNL